MQKEWFETWFDSPYYHVLYSHRDEQEAEFFLDNLIGKLKPAPGSRVLDLACGKGRHCIYLSKKGFDVTGIDISAHNIREAVRFANDKLEFYLHDMRKVFRINYFDAILNLFTSFGYFRTERENREVIRSAVKGLKPGGLFVLDYLNAQKVIRCLVPGEEKTCQGVRFQIRRYVEKGFIFKEIAIDDQGRTHHFTERVQALSHTDLQAILRDCGLNMVDLYGDYSLHPFDAAVSDRVILIAQKP
ncbi:MAG: class I SAM-dependent methyltransferase [Bacteroidota bacterium]